MRASLTWAYLQERITTTAYATTPDSFYPAEAQEYFLFPVVLNTIQSAFAFLCGSLYLYASSGMFRPLTQITVMKPLLLVSITSVLASPFGYASLAHVDYLTLFRKSYPFSKYLVVLAVTTGVAIFTIYHPPKHGANIKGPAKSSTYGMSLLAINLLFDGLTNTVQDHIFESPSRYGLMNGPQLMVSLNFLATSLTTLYLVLTPLIPTSLLAVMAHGSIRELANAIIFLKRHPDVFWDVLGFAACGAIGQIFIFTALERFSSLMLTTVTVTRKMLTMLVSILWFGKKLTKGQVFGVALVFGGIGFEAYLSQEEKRQKSSRWADMSAKEKRR